MRYVTETPMGKCYSSPWQVNKALEQLELKPKTKAVRNAIAYFSMVKECMGLLGSMGGIPVERTKYIEDEELEFIEEPDNKGVVNEDTSNL